MGILLVLLCENIGKMHVFVVNYLYFIFVYLTNTPFSPQTDKPAIAPPVFVFQKDKAQKVSLKH